MIRFRFQKHDVKIPNDKKTLLPLPNTSLKTEQSLSKNLGQNEQFLRKEFKNCSDVVFRSFQIQSQTKMLVVFVDGLADMKILDDSVLKPLMFYTPPGGVRKDMNFMKQLEQKLVGIGTTELENKFSTIVKQVLNGAVVILADEEDTALVADIKGYETRSVSEPLTEAVIRGPREGFTENITTNTSLLRRRLRTPKMKMEALTLGEQSNTNVVITYIDGVVTDSVVEEVRKRVSRIKIDGILESGYIEEFIEDNPGSPFPSVQITERPDVVAAGLLQGKVAILVDNTPFVMVVPLLFIEGTQASEDYYERWMIMTMIRWLRWMYIFIALSLPSLYVAITTYHQEMIPTNLLIAVAANREQVPFPAFIEAFGMEIVFEALREAGIRLPKPTGQAISIVGGLVIGQAAVQAGMVSSTMVIVVALTGIATFTIPHFEVGVAIRMLRFPLMFLSATLGMFGYTIGLLAMVIHLSQLRSFGVPYLSPIMPLTPDNLKDTFVRVPWWKMNLRPRVVGYKNPERVANGQMPSPKRGKHNHDKD